MSKYTEKQAEAKARQIWERFGSKIAEVCAGTPVTEEFLGGFVGVEAGTSHGVISETATRFEPGVFHHLQLVRDGLAKSWSHITTADLQGATDDALHNLATSYGLTQIMGWHMIHDLAGSIADLRDPDKHLGYAVQLLDVVADKYLRLRNWEAVLHIWNSGTPTGRTYDPDYVHNALAVKAAYAAILANSPAAAPAPASHAQPAASSEQSAQLPDPSPATSAEPPSKIQAINDEYQKATEKFDRVNDVVTGVGQRRDAVKSLWATVGGVIKQIFLALFAWYERVPWYVYVTVAVLTAAIVLLYIHRQTVMGKIRETAGKIGAGGDVKATATVETTTDGA